MWQIFSTKQFPTIDSAEQNLTKFLHLQKKEKENQL